MFTPTTTTLGALLLHISSSTLLLTNSQILGCSSLLSSVFSPSLTTTPTLLGLLISPLAIRHLAPWHLPTYPSTPWHTLLTAATLVGAGTKLANGCTSGHMLLGVARGSFRSLVATGVFFTTAVVTAYLSSSPPSCVGGPCYTPTYPPTAFAVTTVVLAAITAVIIRGLLKKESSRVVARVYSGFVFGLGLLVSGMAAPGKTLGFMSVFEMDRWDPSLLAVAVVGVGGNAIAWMRRGRGPRLVDGGWKVPEGGSVDWRLALGSVLFGVGWGLTGVCPGPAAVAAVLNGWKGVGWVAAFLGGRVLAGLV
ncbi:hypothetical protein K440DRAFT_618965 [Wilcoxina mikolae CBS 423.85]|nr:hypothetical protein K440DRAFT_618965 [Wilcoxina mikolae CBS 423.85]